MENSVLTDYVAKWLSPYWVMCKTPKSILLIIDIDKLTE